MKKILLLFGLLIVFNPLFSKKVDAIFFNQSDKILIFEQVGSSYALVIKTIPDLKVIDSVVFNDDLELPRLNPIMAKDDSYVIFTILFDRIMVYHFKTKKFNIIHN